MNVRQATISALESGAADTKVSTLMDVLAALGFDLALASRQSGDESFEDLF